jgi:hypothetical protein
MIAAALLAAIAVAGVGAVEFVLPGYETECFFQEVSSGNKLTGSFEVLTGGMHDVDATVSPSFRRAALQLKWQFTGLSLTQEAFPCIMRVADTNLVFNA